MQPEQSYGCHRPFFINGTHNLASVFSLLMTRACSKFSLFIAASLSESRFLSDSALKRQKVSKPKQVCHICQVSKPKQVCHICQTQTGLSYMSCLQIYLDQGLCLIHTSQDDGTVIHVNH